MKTYRLPQTDLEVSCLAYGCMNLGGSWNADPPTAQARQRAAQLLAQAVELGFNFFDHADIYGRGKSEAVFGAALQQQPGLRERIVIQTKCGIRFKDDPAPGAPARYDFSYEHILRSVEGSLRRLQTGYIDILLLHRPDPLVEPEEAARAFSELHRSGKVRYFGVSNHTPGQIELLRRYVEQPLVANQVELNLLHAGLIELGILANQAAARYTGAGGTLDYCRLHGITLQAWAPVAGGRLIDPPAEASEQVRRAAARVRALAEARGVSREAIALAWLLRHPAGIQPVVGTTNPQRLAASRQAADVTLSREEWSSLLEAARGAPVP